MIYSTFKYSNRVGVDAVPGSEGVQSLDNLCGDLNKGYIPNSPFKTMIGGQSYPL